MSPAFVQRAVALVAICFVAVIGAVALTHRGGGSDDNLPGAVPVPGTKNGYYTGRAAPYAPSAAHPRTACGEPFTARLGYSTAFCGRLYIRFHGHEVLTQVIDRGPSLPGRDFDITKALANRLGLHGAQTIQWRFAK